MSLFNRMDSYDTFAHSEGLTREQIESALAKVYDNKPTKSENALIRDGKLPTVYCQYVAPDDTLVQSAISYLPTDYTGERTSYMVHSIILDEEEKRQHLEDPAAAVFNPAVFVRDLSGFDLTAPTSRPDTAYPTVAVPVLPADDPAKIAENYDMGMVKRLIYALICIPCGKTKALHLSLPAAMPDEDSANCVAFYNSILQIFPYHLRRTMSFVSYVTDCTKYSGFKIKCMPEELPAAPSAKGITLKLGSKEFAGMNDKNVATNAMTVDFFYQLLTRDDLRRQFIEFCRIAVERNPAYLKITLKNISHLILLFSILSGTGDPAKILPDDAAVFSFVSIYDRNREILTDDYRSRAMDVLWRYPQNRKAIPKNVFVKVTGLYADELPTVKKTVMDVVLELIHTDVMREKLFGFIRPSYDAEDAQTKEKILDSLCRVYYGGFLQVQILDFFRTHFAGESAAGRRMILDKLLLTIRTPRVQSTVLELLDEFYPVFTDEEKESFYAVFEEMIPDADELTGRLAELVDRHIEDDRREDVAARIMAALEKDEQRGSHEVCRALMRRRGFTEEVIVRKIVGDWNGQPIFDEFVQIVASRPLPEQAETIAALWATCGDLPADVADRLLTTLGASFDGLQCHLFEVIDASDSLEALKKEHPAAAGFADKMQKTMLWPAAEALLPTVFDQRRYPDGVHRVAALADTRSYIRKAAAYGNVEEYLTMLKTVREEPGTEVLVHAARLEEHPVRLGAAEQLRRDLAEDERSDAQIVYGDLAIGYLKSDILPFNEVGNQLRTLRMKRDRTGTEDAQTFAEQVDTATLGDLIKAGAALYGADVPAEVKEQIIAENGELMKYVRGFIAKYDRHGNRLVQDIAETLEAPETFAEAMQPYATFKAPFGGFFKRPTNGK